MNVTRLVLAAMILLISHPAGAIEGKVILEETFSSELSKEWFWGLGTWTARDGILRGFESGERRHGPVKMRKLPDPGGARRGYPGAPPPAACHTVSGGLFPAVMLQVLDIANFFMATKGAVLHGTPANAIAAFAIAIRPPKWQNSGSRWH